jgi:hypothetical protein
MPNRVLLLIFLWLPIVAMADDTSTSGPADRAPLSFTVNFTAGFSSTFQMPLGGSFGAGPDVMDTMSASLNNVFRNGDSISVFGWNTTDLPSVTPDWQGGLNYSTRLLHYGPNSLTLTAGLQRWLLPNVGSGAKDWLTAENLTYGTRVKKVPFFVSESAWTLLKSTLPTGSAIYTQVYTEHSLLKRPNFQLLLRQGPAHSYSWGFYGLQGNCVLHYGGSLVAIWKENALSAGYRQQFGLQNAVPNAHYWEFSLTRPLLKWTRPN